MPQLDTDGVSDERARGQSARRFPISVRLSVEHAHWVTTYAGTRGCSRTDAIRQLLAIGYHLAEANQVEVLDVVRKVHHQLTESFLRRAQLTEMLTETTQALEELSAILLAMNDSFAKVWVESLMANRLLLDAHQRGLVERAREMTTRYLERMGNAPSPADPTA